MDDFYDIEKAKQFSMRKHEKQKIKYTGEPYFNHCLNVANLISNIFTLKTADGPDMIKAALLHDTLENTDTSYQELEHEFGSTVAHYVISLTDTSRLYHGNREQRKKIDSDKFETSCWQVKTIKMADLIENSSSIILNDSGFAKIYMIEYALLFDVLANRGVRADWQLCKIAYDILLRYYKV